MRGNTDSRGVSWDKQKNKWKVRVRGIHIGLFGSLEDAVSAAAEVRKKAGMPDKKITQFDTMEQKIEAVKNAGPKKSG